MRFTLPPDLVNDPLLRWLIEQADEELWAPRIPIVVIERCGTHHALVATWMAISRLLILYRPTRRTDLSTREIAAVAGVSRPRLSGAAGYIQQLVDRGLLHVTGSVAIPGLPSGRTQYDIDIQRLEAESIVQARQTLATGHRPLPQRTHRDQGDFFACLGLDPPADSHDASNVRGMVPDLAPHGASGTRDGCQVLAPDGASREPDLAPVGASDHPIHRHAASTAARSDRDLTPHGARHGLGLPPSGSGLASCDARAAELTPEDASPWHLPAASLASHDAVGKKERMNEGAREAPRTRTELVDLIEHITRTVIHQVVTPALPQSVPDQPDLADPLPATPDGQTPLPAAPAVLWAADRPHLTERDRLLLHELAREADDPSDGYGAYWLGRAILKAELALSERGDRPAIPYVRGILRRWMQEGSWGSDLLPAAPPLADPAPLPGSPDSARAAPAAPPAPPPGNVADSSDSAPAAPPAVQRYTVRSGRPLSAARATLIAQQVTQIDAWNAVLDDWTARGHDFGNLEGLLDRYRREVALHAPLEPPDPTKPRRVSDLAILTRTDLPGEVRRHWHGRFHATPAADRAALIAQFESAYPPPTDRATHETNTEEVCDGPLPAR